jgi:hypothetical protein
MKSVGLTRFPQNEVDLIIAISYLDSLTTEEHIDHIGLRSAARNIMPNIGNGIISQKGMNPEDIVDAYESNDSETMKYLYMKAQKLIELQKLYKELCLEYYNATKDKGEGR